MMFCELQYFLQFEECLRISLLIKRSLNLSSQETLFDKFESFLCFIYILQQTIITFSLWLLLGRDRDRNIVATTFMHMLLPPVTIRCCLSPHTQTHIILNHFGLQEHTYIQACTQFLCINLLYHSHKTKSIVSLGAFM